MAKRPAPSPIPAATSSVNFYDQPKPNFVAARGAAPGLQTPGQADLSNVDCYGINGQLGPYMIEQAHTLLVFLFHGVGGGHPLNVDLAAHRQLLRYPKAHEREIDIAPLVEVAGSIQAYQKIGAARK